MKVFAAVRIDSINYFFGNFPFDYNLYEFTETKEKAFEIFKQKESTQIKTKQWEINLFKNFFKVNNNKLYIIAYVIEFILSIDDLNKLKSNSTFDLNIVNVYSNWIEI